MLMLQENTVSYLPPSHFASRTAELTETGVGSSILKDTTPRTGGRCEMPAHDSPQFASRPASQAWALDLIGVLHIAPWSPSVTFLMSQLKVNRRRAMRPPPGYASITVSQVLEAIEQHGCKWRRSFRKGLRRTAAGELAMDSVLPSLESDPKVVFRLLPPPIPCRPSGNVPAKAGAKASA